MSKKTITKGIITVILLTVSLSLMGWVNTSSKKTASSKLAQIKKAGVLVIGTSADYPPYEFHKVVNGKDEIVGFDISIAKNIAKDLGVKVEFKDMDFDGLLAALVTNKIDMVIAGMNPTPERKLKVDFSDIYYQAVQVVLVRTSDKSKYTSIDSFKGKKIGVQMGTTQEALAKDQMKGSDIKSLSKVTDLILELKNNKVDGIILELPVASSYASKNKDISVTGIKLKNEAKGSAIAVKKNSTEFVKSINKTLSKLVKNKSIDKFVTEANNQVE
jgi:arginine/lysine/histidine transporter system substrate-binding protein